MIDLNITKRLSPPIRPCSIMADIVVRVLIASEGWGERVR